MFQRRVEKLLCPCVAQLAVAAGREDLWKALNYQLLLKTRHKKAEVTLANITLETKNFSCISNVEITHNFFLNLACFSLYIYSSMVFTANHGVLVVLLYKMVAPRNTQNVLCLPAIMIITCLCPRFAMQWWWC